MKSKALMVALSAALLASCGGSTGKATGDSVLKIPASNYQVIPTIPPSSTLAPGETAPPIVESVNPNETTYVVVDGDLPTTIAKKFHVKFQDLMNANGWTLNAKKQVDGFAIGQTIKIPAGSQLGETSTTPTVAPAPGDTSTATNTSIAAAGSTSVPKTTGSTVPSTCKAGGEYVILAEDTSRIKVAKKLGTTVAALDAVNADTKGYKNFVVGAKIKTPAKTGC
jgi:LysM repeat protein